MFFKEIMVNLFSLHLCLKSSSKINNHPALQEFFIFYGLISSHPGVRETEIFFFYSLITSHPGICEKLFSEKYKKFLFFELGKFPPETQQVFLKNSISQNINKAFFEKTLEF